MQQQFLFGASQSREEGGHHLAATIDSAIWEDDVSRLFLTSSSSEARGSLLK